MVVPIAALVAAGSTACATKGFVRTSVGEVNSKVDSLGRSLEETQERTRQNEGRIADVDSRAQAAAKEASTAAANANTAAVAANSTATTAVARADTANTKVEVLDKAARRLVFEVVLSEDNGNFKFANTELPDEAKAKLDQLVTQIKADPKGIYFEIEGHTDNTGSEITNQKLGLERAESVKRYLYEQHQVPLHKINVISYGEDKPIAPNKTHDGRAQNRRVVIKILT
jgi:outer membrane protein OmpA-like peptidoglycan-associated protein